MLRPRQVKFKKTRKGRIRGLETRVLGLVAGTYGLKALEGGRLTARQIEATRRSITRKMKRRGRVWIRVFPSTPITSSTGLEVIRVFPSTPITSKPVEVRMGKGKGNVDYWVAPVRPGRVLYEIGGVPRATALQALQSGAAKLPLRTKILLGQTT